jgi:hypothetical protein
LTVPAPPRSGDGTIGRGTAWLLTAVFVVVCAFPVGWQASDRGVPSLVEDFPRDIWTQGFEQARQLLEKRFDQRSVFAQTVRVPYRTFLLRFLGHVASNARPGQNGFLFYGNDLRYARGEGPLSPRLLDRIEEARDVRGDAFEEAVRAAVRRVLRQPAPQPPPAPRFVNSSVALRDVVSQFESRGLPVLLVPIPGKVAIYPECFAPGYPLAAGPAENRDYRHWEALLKAEGISLVDLYRPFWEAKGRTAYPVYLKTDSHWSPDGLAVAADEIAARAAAILGPAPPCPFPTERETVSFSGDLIALLDVAHPYQLFPKDTITKTRVRHGVADETIGDRAPVLLLGDSFTMMFLDIDPGSGAGLAAQLMLRLGCGVQTIGGIGSTPAQLLQRLCDRPNALAHKKLVIWTFVDRMIVDPKGWEELQLPPP